MNQTTNSYSKKMLRLAMLLAKMLYFEPHGIDMDSLTEEQIEKICDLALFTATSWFFYLKSTRSYKLAGKKGKN